MRWIQYSARRGLLVPLLNDFSSAGDDNDHPVNDLKTTKKASTSICGEADSVAFSKLANDIDVAVSVRADLSFTSLAALLLPVPVAATFGVVGCCF
jgi:hypothetical protein